MADHPYPQREWPLSVLVCLMVAVSTGVYMFWFIVGKLMGVLMGVL